MLPHMQSVCCSLLAKSGTRGEPGPSTCGPKWIFWPPEFNSPYLNRLRVQAKSFTRELKMFFDSSPNLVAKRGVPFYELVSSRVPF